MADNIKIMGNTVGVPNPRSDWSQTDPTKADYIKNKPNLADKADKTYVNNKFDNLRGQIADKATVDYVDNSMAEAYLDLQKMILKKADATDLDNKVDKVSGKGLSTNDFTNTLKTRLENNTFDYYHSIEYPNDFAEEFNALLDECTDEGVHLIFTRDTDETPPDQYILTVGAYVDYSTDEHNGVFYQSLFNLTDGTLEVRDGIGSEWEKVSVSQTDLNKAIGDVEASLDNIIKKYGLGGDGV